ncbi:MAG TPA: cell division protein FtsL [Myxococcota bacterium]|nr:cell division protein FtsL [Myxococcota bacterium]
MTSDKKRKRTKNRPGPSGWTAGWTAAVIVVAAFSLAAILHVRTKLVAVELGYRLSRAASENKQLQAESRKLRLEVATLRNPRRLRRLAADKLGLFEPRPEQVITIGTPGHGKLAASTYNDRKVP